MVKVKLIVHECFKSKQNPKNVFAAVFLSNADALTTNTHSSIIESTEFSQDSLWSEKGANYGTSEE